MERWGSGHLLPSKIRAAQTMKRVLLAGGAGFLGSHLSLALLQHGYEVICLDNFYTGHWRNLQTCQMSPYFHVLEQDIRTPLDIAADYVLNFACPASPPHYQKDPIYTHQTNVLGTLNLIENALRYQAIFLQASTSEVYGNPLEHPQSETYWGNVNSFGPRACYDEGKRLAEALLYDYHHQKGLDIRIARIFNTYGPHMDALDGRVISNFIIQALQHRPLTIYGSGMQTRSFCYVEDLVQGILALLHTSPPIHTPVNLGNPEEHTLQEIVARILQLTQSQSTLSYHPLPTDDPTQRCPNIKKAVELLKWSPKISLENGLKQTIEYFQQTMAEPSINFVEIE